MTLKRSINQLVDDEQTQRSLRELAAATPIPAARGVGIPSPIASGSGAGGIASPLTEPNYLARTYHVEKTFTTTDGLFSFTVRPIKDVYFKDANSADVQLIFAEPP